jgi:tetratricopeptide (TPR) repeat protein
VRAAREAAARSAPQQSISLATTGLELLSAIPDQQRREQYELPLQMILGSCGSLAKGFAVPEVERAYTKALELVGRADQTPAAIRAMVGLYVYYSRGADYQRAATLQAQMLELVPTLAETRLRGIIHYSVGFRLMYHGEFEAARNQLEQAITWSAGHPRRVQARAAMALTVWNLGYADRAWLFIKEAAAEVRELPDPYTQVMVADNALMISGLSKDIQNTRRYAEEIIEKSTSYGFAAEIGIATIMLAWADGLDGDPKAVDRLRESVAEFEAGEGDLGHTAFLGRIAELRLKFGRNDEAVSLLGEAIDFIAQTGQGYAESEVYRLRGEAELQLGRSHFDSAANWFERAIEAARKRSARMAELHATSDLARLLAKQRQPDKARTMFAEIYGWFTEGFDTADLQDAKALLEKLST